MYAHRVSKATTPPYTNSTLTSSHPSWSHPPRYQDFTRALTPPAEMSSVTSAIKSSYYQQERGHHYADRLPEKQASKASVAPYLPQEVLQPDRPRDSFTSHAITGVSPSRPIKFEPSHEVSTSRRGFQVSTIAANFQIPRSVNDSGGSLSELAAQITCLFWFESADLLTRIEESKVPLQPTRPLAPDAKPTTGFRKWVTTILSTTCVAQNVVILALLFIHRLKRLNPSVRGKPGSEYRLLTVALMLGNKFLDDNTYTNKTWAEVSGINVGEVHIMEVEFLSNLKYCLFTSEQNWVEWQSLLSRYSAFFDKASRPQHLHQPAPILPPASSLHLPMALPSPPASNQASPPYATDFSQHGPVNPISNHYGLTPAPSPLGSLGDASASSSQAGSRKRSHDDFGEPASKRIASGYPSFSSPQRFSTMPMQTTNGSSMPRLHLPSLTIPAPSSSTHRQSLSAAPQLPPLNALVRAMSTVYPSANVHAHSFHSHASAGASAQPQLHSSQQHNSQHASPYGGSTTVSPASAVSQHSITRHPTAQISPSYYLQQRDSPYRPVHHVSTLLHPPPSAAFQFRNQNIELNQMHYQPLGQSVDQRQSGRLPYVAQNIWTDGNYPQEMTPVHRWPGFTGSQQQPLKLSQQ